jgi:hypothetical protein
MIKGHHLVYYQCLNCSGLTSYSGSVYEVENGGKPHERSNRARKGFSRERNGEDGGK